MKSFSDRNPVPIGIIGVLVLVLGLVAAYFSDSLVAGGTTYTAEFTEVAGLRTSNEVRVAGVKVGKVAGLELDGDKVVVEFRVDDDVKVGDQSAVSIEIKTLLGQKYLALTPRGVKPLDPETRIPVRRTRTPFDTTDALSELSKTADEIDTDQLAASFDTIADTFTDTRPEVRSTLNGLSKLSKTVASRDRRLAELLGNSKVVTGALATRDRELRALIGDGNLLLTELQARKQAIDRLLTGVRDLSVQLQGVVSDNQAQLEPALRKLNRVATVLHRNQANLRKGLRNLAPFYRVFTNTLSNGRWFDGYVCGVLPSVEMLDLNSGGCKPPQPHRRKGVR